MPMVAARSATALCGQPLTLKKASIAPSFILSATCWAARYSAQRGRSDCRRPAWPGPARTAAALATEPLEATDVATSPGTPPEPPSLHGREPGGLEMALAIRPPIGK